MPLINLTKSAQISRSSISKPGQIPETSKSGYVKFQDFWIFQNSENICKSRSLEIANILHFQTIFVLHIHDYLHSLCLPDIFHFAKGI